MTDDPTLDPEEQLASDAREAAATPPDPEPDAADLPDDAADGDAGEDDAAVADEPVTEENA